MPIADHEAEENKYRILIANLTLLAVLKLKNGSSGCGCCVLPIHGVWPGVLRRYQVLMQVRWVVMRVRWMPALAVAFLRRPRVLPMDSQFEPDFESAFRRLPLEMALRERL